MSFALETVYPYVLPSAKSAGAALVDQAIVSAADKLLRRVRLWSMLLPAVTPVIDLTDPNNPVGQTDYVLPVPVGSQCVKLVGWSLGGVRYAVLTNEQAVQRGLEPGGYLGGDSFDYPSSDDADDTPVYVQAAYMVSETTVRVQPAPTDTTSQMLFNVNLTVLNGATTLPDPLLPYVRLLAYDALSTLQSLPEKDYSDMQQAGLNAGRFEDGVAKLAIRTTRAFGSGKVRRRVRAY